RRLPRRVGPDPRVARDGPGGMDGRACDRGRRRPAPRHSGRTRARAPRRHARRDDARLDLAGARKAAAVMTLAAALATAGCGGGASSSSAPPPGSCADVTKPKPSSPSKLQAPARLLDAAKHWTLTFRTSCGSFAVRLAPQTSPHATASLVALARSGYFDG